MLPTAETRERVKALLRRDLKLGDDAKVQKRVL